MPFNVFFDTDVFHVLGETFATRSLDLELSRKILLSPVTIVEVYSQLTVRDNERILRHLKAVENWLDISYAGVLPWMNNAIAQIGFKQPPGEDDIAHRVQQTLLNCFNASSAEELRSDATKMKDDLDKTKHDLALEFDKFIKILRQKPLSTKEFREFWVLSLAKRAGVNPGDYSTDSVADALSAYCEFEEAKLHLAAKNLKYNPYKNQNDLMDAEQLIYLGDSGLHFLTLDQGYRKKVNISVQAQRIYSKSLADFEDPKKVEKLLTEITT